MEKQSCSKRIKTGLEIRNMRQTDLCRLTGIPKSAMSQYIKGNFEPKQDRIFLIARALRVSEAWLMGYDVPMMPADLSKDVSAPNIFPLKTKKVPLLGTIACGEPILAEEEHGNFVSVSEDLNVDFCLVAKGDSMTGAHISDGDVVFIRKQEMVNNGEIAAVIIDGEATLKRVYYHQTQNKLILSPENSAYEPLVYLGSELEQIRIIGKAIAFQSLIK